MGRDIQLCGAGFVLIVSLLGGANAQQSGGGKSAAPKSATRSVPSPQTLPQTIYFMGKVVMDTGGAPPTSVPVYRVCNGTSRRQAFTSGDGSFAFMVGDRASNPLPDASDDTRQFGPDNQLSRSDATVMGLSSFSSPLADCELRADLAGYTSSSIRLDPSMNNSNVGIIVLHSRGKKAEGMVSVASLEVPDKTRKEYEKGTEQLEKGNIAAAEKSLRKAIDQYPKFAEAWLRLGDLEQRRLNMDSANADYQEAINADPNFLLPYVRMTYLAAIASKWEQTRQLSERVISLDPVSFPLAYYYNAAAEFNLNHFDRAEISALRAENLDKLHGEPRIELLLALIYNAKGAHSSAVEHYRVYLKLVPDSPLKERVKSDLAKTEEMAKSENVAVVPVNNK